MMSAQSTVRRKYHHHVVRDGPVVFIRFALLSGDERLQLPVFLASNIRLVSCEMGNTRLEGKGLRLTVY